MNAQPTAQAVILNAKELEEARNWLSDCEWRDVDADDIYAMPADVIHRAVQRHYDGGLEAFVLATGYREV